MTATLMLRWLETYTEDQDPQIEGLYKHGTRKLQQYFTDGVNGEWRDVPTEWME